MSRNTYANSGTQPYNIQRPESPPEKKTSQKTTKDQEKYMQTMRDRFEAARTGWEIPRKDFREDLRFVSGDPSDQWDPVVKQNRDADWVPALTMDRLNPLINQIVNQARQDRPQPKVSAGDEGNPQTAEIIEGKFRHVLYESHADLAFDCAQAYAASGGFGYVEWTCEYVGRKGLQEPRLKRVPDPLSVYFDPAVQELDYSDAEYAFKRKRYKRGEFERAFPGYEAVPFPFPDGEELNEWGDEDTVWVAVYWWVEKVETKMHQLADGSEVADEDLMEGDEPARSWPVTERIVHRDIVDGQKRLEESIWASEWIGIIPTLGLERISNGKRRYVSAVRYARDPQQFINVGMSKTATRMADVNDALWLGTKGQFKDKKWRDGRRHYYLEAEPVTIQGNLAPPPERANAEPMIQGSTEATAQGIDALKGAIGYVDTVTKPSQADLSGIAVERRSQQTSLANFHYEDNGLQAMWHTGRVGIDLMLSLADTPRIWKVMKEDQRQSQTVPITMDMEPGVNPEVPGYEGQPHIKIDDGDYGVIIQAGKSYAAKVDEEDDFLTSLVQSDPQLAVLYLPTIFRLRGYEDLAEIAELAMPPQIQQALQAKKGGVNPAQLQQQNAVLTQQLQQAKQLLQQVALKLQTKSIETQGKVDVEKLKLIRSMIEKQMDHSHDAVVTHLAEATDAVEHVTGMQHQQQMAQQAALQPAPGGIQ